MRWTKSREGQRGEDCPRCRAGTMALGRLVVCHDFACDWSRPRFEPGPAHAKRMQAGRLLHLERCAQRSRQEEGAVVAALVEAAAPLTTVEISARTGISPDRLRDLLARVRDRVAAERIGHSHALQFRLLEEARAC